MPRDRAKPPADIFTDRNDVELPILERVFPIDEPAVDDSSAPPVGPLPVPPSEQSGAVTMNTHHLEYQQPMIALSLGRRLLGALLPTVVFVMLGAAILAPAVAAQDPSGGELSIKSARFDIGTEEQPSPTGYRSLVVVDQGVEHNLGPMPGSVRVTMGEPHATAIAATVGGQQHLMGDAGFTDRVAAALTSPTVSDFVTLGNLSSGGPVSIDVSFDRPLGPGDHLLVQEGNGNGHVELMAVDAAGTVVGVPVHVGAPYQVDTGHPQDEGTATQAWASVVDVSRLGAGATPVAGIRLTGQDAEVKLLALVPLADTTAGVSEAASVTASEGSTPVYASVGLVAKVQPATAVDGADCVTSPAAPVAVGQASTFCFLVTNLGTTSLADVRITDPQLGLDNAELPMASGEAVLQPGDQVVLYHHTVAAERTDQVKSVVSARPVDQAGNSLDDLISPTGIADAGTITETTGAVAGSGTAGLAEVPATQAVTGVGATAAQDAPPPQLAMTGVRTEPWILVIFAMGLIFTGYTAFAAFNGAVSGRNEEACGHAQLDSLGFD